MAYQIAPQLTLIVGSSSAIEAVKALIPANVLSALKVELFPVPNYFSTIPTTFLLVYSDDPKTMAMKIASLLPKGTAEEIRGVWYAHSNEFGAMFQIERPYTRDDYR